MAYLNDENKLHPGDGTAERCAAYARFSADLQRLASIEDQIRECRDAAEERGFQFLEQYVRSDEAKTGRTLVGREGLDDLLKLAAQSPRPFDRILFDDTSRFGRNLTDTLRLTDIFAYHGVVLHFVSCNLESTNPNFRQLFIQQAQQDEAFSKGLGKKSHRGQRGRFLKGYVPAGRAYGYFHNPIEDPHRKGEYGRPLVIAVERKKHPEEAAVVERMFIMRASGMSCLDITKTLNREGILSPLHGVGDKPRKWHVTTVSRILQNEKYRGHDIWNRRKYIWNPMTGRKEERFRPKSEWEEFDNPELRIVSDELWEEVQRRINSSEFGGRRRGGLNRSEASRSYVFSGCMTCGPCGGNINIVGGSPPSAQYGCHNHKFHGICENGLVIQQRILEQELLKALAGNLTRPAIWAELAAEFEKRVHEAVKEHAQAVKQSTRTPADFDRCIAEVEARIANLLDAIEKNGMSDRLQARYKLAEKELEDLQREKSILVEPPLAPNLTEADIREFLERKMTEIADVLASDPVRAKAEIQKRVSKLRLEPTETPEGKAYRVTGDLRLFCPGNEEVMVNPSGSRWIHHYSTWSMPIAETIFCPAQSRRKTRIKGNAVLAEAAPEQKSVQTNEAPYSETLSAVPLDLVSTAAGIEAAA
jgi:site-specific DNA recombinase